MSITRESEHSHRASSGEPLLRGEVAFRLLVDAVTDYAIFLLGPDGRVLTWNVGAQRIKGYSSDEIIGQHFSVFYTPEERDARRPQRLLKKAEEQGRFEDEGWRVRKDGTRFWADVIVTALRDGDGKPYAYAKITRDLTERRAAEQREAKLLAEQRARTAAEEALRARDRFLSIASHELKTPVASLQLAVEGLARAKELGRLDERRLDTALGRMTNATNRLGALVRELLDVTRLHSGRATFAPVPIDLPALAAEVIDRFEDIGDSSRIRLEGDATASVLGDPSRLDQVLTNVIDNALKYSDAGTQVVVRVEALADGAMVTVIDDGIGFDLADGRAFEAFARGQNAEHIQGMGLGLFITQHIVDRHGGRLTVSAREGTGTIVSIWLPSEPPASEDATAE